ncbi:membrane protein [Christiangramia forsetii KT0803]|uniref:Membrane protein n=1 Tax=Christiangramia forsetii (strain DSM 17595 / CGMCC 1.15422 / KT0803) TaxID=411154 RepID=A0M469_CHRFK|nr:membrane protein [Christiangramia forsetii KT0803]
MALETAIYSNRLVCITVFTLCFVGGFLLLPNMNNSFAYQAFLLSADLFLVLDYIFLLLR